MRPVWHIYPTRGASGAYVHALQTALHQGGIRSYAFVSRYYTFDTGGAIRYFFPITDSFVKRNKPINILRGIELITGYFFIWAAALVMRPVICLHLAGYLGGMNILFRGCKLAGLKVYLTCHDVTEDNANMTRSRLYMLLNADKLIVHSSEANKKLRENLGPAAAQHIVQYPFPFSSYDSILTPEGKEKAAATLQKVMGGDADYFLFLGYVRKSKGVDTLLEAWKISRCKNKFKLFIAGRWGDTNAIDLLNKATELDNCVVLNKYLSDEEFVCFIEKSRFSILPYNDYSHSSVLISCAKYNGAVIVSDIELFKDYLRDYDLTFPKGNVKALAAVLDKAAEMPENEVKLRAAMLKESVEEYDRKLPEEIARAYKEP